MEMFIENTSRYNFADTVERLTEAVTGASWKVSHVHDLRETMKKNNLEVLPVMVLEVCKPSLSYKILSKDDERVYSALMPCRISVYEKEDGNVYLSRMNAGSFASSLKPSASEVMTAAFFEMEKILEQIIKL